MIQAYNQGADILMKDIQVDGAKSLPQWKGKIVSKNHVLDGAAIRIPYYDLVLTVINSVENKGLWEHQVVDRTGFPTKSVLDQNKIYPAGEWHATIIRDLFDLPVQFERRLASQIYQMIPLAKGYKKATMVNAILEELAIRIQTDESNKTYIAKEFDYAIRYQTETTATESYTGDLSPNHFTISSINGLTVKVFDVEDINYNGTIYADPLTSYFLFAPQDLIKLGYKKLEQSMGLRGSMFFSLAGDAITNLNSHLGACWLVNKKVMRVTDIGIKPEKLEIRGIQVNHANFATG